MRCFTWSGGEIRQGIALTQDERLGQVIFLGESGRGRRYEKIALGKRNPAEVVEGRVLEAHPVKITLAPKDGKPEKVFFVLENQKSASAAVLMRISSYGGYIRGASGRYSTVAGQPETLIAGYGAFGDAGRVGSWTDGLVVMKPGDVIRIHPTRTWGGGDSVLWLGETGQPETASWQDYENLQAVAKAEAMIAEAETTPQALKLAFGQMPCFTYAGRGEIRSGIELSKGTTGPVVALGESGRGRKLVELPIVGFEPGEVLQEAAVVKLSGEVTGLTTSDQKEADAFLVRMLPLASVHRQFVRVEKLVGEPVKVAEGNFASGDAGYAGSAGDSLWVLKPGDVVLVNWSGDPNYVVQNIGGKPAVTHFVHWEIAEAKHRPQDYAAKGKVLFGQTIPSEWIGRVVSVQVFCTEDYKPTNELETKYTGELVSISPVVLNLGWDGRDRQDVTVTGGVWTKIEADKQVRRPEGSELSRREEAKAEAERQKAVAEQLSKEPFFSCFPQELQARVSEVAEARERWRDDPVDFGQMSTEEICRWSEQAGEYLSQARSAEAEARDLHSRQERGEILVGFEAWHRRGGRTNCGDGWVIRSDGSRRERDSDSVPRHKSDGTFRWERVVPEELALRWSCHHTGNVAGNSKFEIAKLPVGGCTPEQLQAVREIEEEIGAPPGAFGFDPEIKRKAEERLAAIRAAAEQVLGYLPDSDYLRVIGENGVYLEDWGGLRVNWSAPFSERCDGRDAQVVRSVRTADGVLQFLAYEKYGGQNLAMRWREAAPEPEPESSTSDEPQGGGDNIASKLAALKKKWGAE